jgi:hypothetical protein
MLDERADATTSMSRQRRSHCAGKQKNSSTHEGAAEV